MNHSPHQSVITNDCWIFNGWVGYMAGAHLNTSISDDDNGGDGDGDDENHDDDDDGDDDDNGRDTGCP